MLHFILSIRCQMKYNILFVLDQLPFPPRNGVTIPTFHYLKGLAKLFNVFLLFVTDNKDGVDQDQLKRNKEFVEQCWVLEGYTRLQSERVLQELLMQNFYFCPWNWGASIGAISRILDGKAFDFVWISPLSVGNVMAAFDRLIHTKPVYIAGINDCATAVYRNMKRDIVQKGLKRTDRIRGGLAWLRSIPMAKTEAKILSNYDLILVQTASEYRKLIQISHGGLEEKILVQSNGVNERLFTLPISSRATDILFLGMLNGMYKKNLHWFLDQVWPTVKKICPITQFHVIGRNPSSDLYDILKADSRIIYREFVPDICDAFNAKAVMIAPIFKNYGIINKVVEAMAAGVPVVGDAGCFNGIPGFKDGIHGYVANDPKDMAFAITTILNSSNVRKNTAVSARKLVLKHFCWPQRIEAIYARLQDLQSKKYSGR